MSKLKTIFENIRWPEEFVVEFKDGIEQVFVSSQGISWDDGNDADDGRENISCCWKKKSPSQQRFKQIQFYIDEVAKFKTQSGEVIWNLNS